ncbi:hypothetical protein [Clostridium cuniculi]|uniref:hypothetical protein n=1 Tax=Clostridium cuniculi TaxID=2548455 RepID=UPI0010551C32|nr:hypothetical protein [Clostridium cuniculi]
MIEIKIRFKNGDMGYFKPDEGEESNMKAYLSGLQKVMRNEGVGYITLTDLVDNKETIIALQEIVSFGYSNI